MKLLKHLAQYAVLSIVPALLFIACAKDTTLVNGGTTETTSGNIIGTIWNGNGTLAKGVWVRLTPVDFNPYLRNDTIAIDSMQTDENGTYSFHLKSSGFFNMSAQNRGSYCYEDSVYGSERAQSRIKDDTLKAPGSISGVARLQPGDDNRQIIILVLGTNTCVNSLDSSGAFSISVVAEGNYALRILSTDKNYGYLDTVVTVKSGENTTIAGVLQLPFEGVPAIGAVSAQLDIHTMYVTLSWPRCDTSKIAAFYVFRNTAAGSPFAILKSTDTSFTDDVILLNPDTLAFRDTLRYLVAAVGKNRTLGKVGVAHDILLRNFLTPIDTIPVSIGTDLMNLHEYFNFVVNRNHDVYFYGFSWIWKIDSVGSVTARYSDSVGENDGPVVLDGKGSVYACQEWPDRVAKFSSDLIPLAIKTVADSLQLSKIMLATNDNGSVYLFSIHDFQQITCVQAFDSTLSLMPSDTIHESDLGTPIMHDDTFFVWTSNGIKAFDIHLNYLRTLDCDDVVNKYYPMSLKNGTFLHHIERQVNFTANDISLIFFDLGSSGYMDNDNVFLAVDTNNKLVGRCHFNGFRYVFDGVDRVYVYNYSKQSIYIYKVNE
jgi:hypothetical protein